MDTLEKVLLGVAAVYTGYLLLLSVAALAGRRRTGRRSHPRSRFTILVPAHDEATVLPRLLDGLDGLDYPEELRELVVIADNCRDATATIGRARGVRVLERTDPRRGKGHALSWALGQLMGEGGHDAFVILDADSVLTPDLLTHLDAALQDGALVAQAYCTVGNAEMSWRTSLMAGDLALVHYLRPLGRRALGMSAGLQGNGMCLTRRVLETVPWEAVSITEDQEYHLRLVCSGIKVQFVPDAAVPTVMQGTMRAARDQELRWEGGRFRLARQHVGRLLAAAWRRPSWSMSSMCLETALDLTTPPFAILVLFTTGWIGLDALRWAIGGSGSALVPWAALLCAQAFYVLIGCALAGVPARTYAALALYGPVYALTKVWYCTQIAFGVSHEWVPTARRSV